MSTKTKSPAMRLLEEVSGPLTFGSTIEALRLCDEISQTELAKKMKISRAHLCDIEKGRRTVSPERAARFAKVMGYYVPSFVRLALQDQLDKSGLKLTIEVKAA
jgi:transcriptional regulator with XRE-family HTH domain